VQTFHLRSACKKKKTNSIETPVQPLHLRAAVALLLFRSSACKKKKTESIETPVQPLHLRAAVALLLFRLCHQLEEKLEDGMRAEVSQELRDHVFALDDLVV
jgi:hypothetical protein